MYTLRNSLCKAQAMFLMNVCSVKVYQEAPGVEHIPVVQIDLSVPLKVPGETHCVNSTTKH